MKWIFAALLIFPVVDVLSGCAPGHPRAIAPPNSGGNVALAATRTASTPRALVGDQAIVDLNRWYNDTRSDCGGATQPAFLCTGVMFRATQTNPSFLPWNPNPSSTGVSFSWMRSDINFSDLVYNYWNGFLFYPKNEAPIGANSIDVLCAFPMDADTNARGLSGCGSHVQEPTRSVPCDDQGIVTSAAWLGHFNSAANKYNGQCGWNMHSGYSADRFMQAIRAHESLSAQWWAVQNEMRLAKWAQNSAVPIRAFFYVPGRTSALQNAQNDQLRYSQSFGGSFAPIVQLTLPTSKGGKASFRYQVGDQAVNDPGGGTVDPGTAYGFEDLPVGNASTLTTSWGKVQFSSGGIGVATTGVVHGHYAYDRQGLVIFFNNAITQLSFSYNNTSDHVARIDFKNNTKFIDPYSSGTITMDADGGYTYVVFTPYGNGEIRIDDILAQPPL